MIGHVYAVDREAGTFDATLPWGQLVTGIPYSGFGPIPCTEVVLEGLDDGQYQYVGARASWQRVLHDHFARVGATFGDTNWRQASAGGGVASVASAALGVARLSTTTALSNACDISKDDLGFLPDDGHALHFVTRVRQMSLAYRTVRVGFGMDAATNGAGFLYDAPDTTETITASQSWVVPDGVTSVFVECVGTGGLGGVSGGSEGGGGGGAFASDTVAVTPGASITLTCALGSDTSFGASVIAKQGGNASVATGGTGGSGAGSTGSVKNSGGNGSNANTGTGQGGGGGGGGGSALAGGNGAVTAGGAGRAPYGGNGGNGGAPGTNGGAAANYGGGGGGGGNAGGNRSSPTIGVIVLTYTVSTTTRWQAETVTGGAATTADVSTPGGLTAAGWDVLEGLFVPGQWAAFWTNGGSPTTVAVNVPTTGVEPKIKIVNKLAGEARTLDVDYFLAHRVAPVVRPDSLLTTAITT